MKRSVWPGDVVCVEESNPKMEDRRLELGRLAYQRYQGQQESYLLGLC